MTLIEIVEGTFAAVGQQTTDTQLALIVADLAGYPAADIEVALARCRRELRGKMSLSDILDRLPNGRPGVEEAWALIQQVMRNEQASIVWTDEMREAYGVAAVLADDPVAARMAFKEKYTACVASSRALQRPVSWSVSLGWDQDQRTEAVQDAARRNLISQTYVDRLIGVDGTDGADIRLTQIGKSL